MDLQKEVRTEVGDWGDQQGWSEDGNDVMEDEASPDSNEFTSLLQTLLAGTDSQQPSSVNAHPKPGEVFLPVPSGRSFAQQLWEEEEQKQSGNIAASADSANPRSRSLSISDSPQTLSRRDSPGSVLPADSDTRPPFTSCLIANDALGVKSTMFVPVTPMRGDQRTRLAESPESLGPVSRLVDTVTPGTGLDKSETKALVSVGSGPQGTSSGEQPQALRTNPLFEAETKTPSDPLAERGATGPFGAGRGSVSSTWGLGPSERSNSGGLFNRLPGWGRGIGAATQRSPPGTAQGHGSPPTGRGSDFPPLGASQASRNYPPEKDTAVVMLRSEFPELPKPPSRGQEKAEKGGGESGNEGAGAVAPRAVMHLRKLTDLSTILSPHKNAWTCWNPVTGSRESQEDIEAAQKEMAAELQTAQKTSLPRTEADNWDDDDRAGTGPPEQPDVDVQTRWEPQHGFGRGRGSPSGSGPLFGRGFGRWGSGFGRGLGEEEGSRQGGHLQTSRSDIADSWRRKEPLPVRDSPPAKAQTSDAVPQPEVLSTVSPTDATTAPGGSISAGDATPHNGVETNLGVAASEDSRVVGSGSELEGIQKTPLNSSSVSGAAHPESVSEARAFSGDPEGLVGSEGVSEGVVGSARLEGAGSKLERVESGSVDGDRLGESRSEPVDGKRPETSGAPAEGGKLHPSPGTTKLTPAEGGQSGGEGGVERSVKWKEMKSAAGLFDELGTSPKQPEADSGVKGGPAVAHEQAVSPTVPAESSVEREQLDTAENAGAMAAGVGSREDGAEVQLLVAEPAKTDPLDLAAVALEKPKDAVHVATPAIPILAVHSLPVQTPNPFSPSNHGGFTPQVPKPFGVPLPNPEGTSQTFFGSTSPTVPLANLDAAIWAAKQAKYKKPGGGFGASANPPEVWQKKEPMATRESAVGAVASPVPKALGTHHLESEHGTRSVEESNGKLGDAVHGGKVGAEIVEGSLTPGLALKAGPTQDAVQSLSNFNTLGASSNVNIKATASKAQVTEAEAKTTGDVRREGVASKAMPSSASAPIEVPKAPANGGVPGVEHPKASPGLSLVNRQRQLMDLITQRWRAPLGKQPLVRAEARSDESGSEPEAGGAGNTRRAASHSPTEATARSHVEKKTVEVLPFPGYSVPELRERQRRLGQKEQEQASVNGDQEENGVKGGGNSAIERKGDQGSEGEAVSVNVTGSLNGHSRVNLDAGRLLDGASATRRNWTEEDIPTRAPAWEADLQRAGLVAGSAIPSVRKAQDLSRSAAGDLAVAQRGLEKRSADARVPALQKWVPKVAGVATTKSGEAVSRGSDGKATTGAGPVSEMSVSGGTASPDQGVSKAREASTAVRSGTLVESSETGDGKSALQASAVAAASAEPITDSDMASASEAVKVADDREEEEASGGQSEVSPSQQPQQSEGVGTLNGLTRVGETQESKKEGRADGVKPASDQVAEFSHATSSNDPVEEQARSQTSGGAEPTESEAAGVVLSKPEAPENASVESAGEKSDGEASVGAEAADVSWTADDVSREQADGDNEGGDNLGGVSSSKASAHLYLSEGPADVGGEQSGVMGPEAEVSGVSSALTPKPKQKLLWSDDVDASEGAGELTAITSGLEPETTGLQPVSCSPSSGISIFGNSLPSETTIIAPPQPKADSLGDTGAEERNGSVVSGSQTRSSEQVGLDNNLGVSKTEGDVWTFPEEALLPAESSGSAAEVAPKAAHVAPHKAPGKPGLVGAKDVQVEGGVAATKAKTGPAAKKLVIDEAFERLFLNSCEKLTFKMGRPFDISVLNGELKRRIPNFDIKNSPYPRFVDLCKAMAGKGHVRLFRASNMTFAALPDDPAQYGWGPNGLYQLPVGTNRSKTESATKLEAAPLAVPKIAPLAGVPAPSQIHPPAQSTSVNTAAPTKPTNGNAPLKPEVSHGVKPNPVYQKVERGVVHARTASSPGPVLGGARVDQVALPRSTSLQPAAQGPAAVKPSAVKASAIPKVKKLKADVEAEALGAIMLILCENPSIPASTLGNKLIEHDRGLSEQVKFHFGGIRNFLKTRPELFYIADHTASNPDVGLFTGQARPTPPSSSTPSFTPPAVRTTAHNPVPKPPVANKPQTEQWAPTRETANGATSSTSRTVSNSAGYNSTSSQNRESGYGEFSGRANQEYGSSVRTNSGADVAPRGADMAARESTTSTSYGRPGAGILPPRPEGPGGGYRSSNWHSNGGPDRASTSGRGPGSSQPGYRNTGVYRDDGWRQSPDEASSRGGYGPASNGRVFSETQHRGGGYAASNGPPQRGFSDQEARGGGFAAPNGPPGRGFSDFEARGGESAGASAPQGLKKAEWHLFLNNLPLDCPPPELKRALSQFGEVHGLTQPRGRQFAFVRFVDRNNARAPLAQGSFELGQRRITVTKYSG